VLDPADEDFLLSSSTDEFAPYFSRTATPKVFVTTSHKPKAATFGFVADLLEVIPNSTFYKRVGGARLSSIMKAARRRKFTHAVVLNEGRDSGLPDSMLVVHLGASGIQTEGGEGGEGGGDGKRKRKSSKDDDGGDDGDESDDDGEAPSASPPASDSEGSDSDDPSSLSSLGTGPTARFRVTNVKRCKDIRGHGRPTAHNPELVLRGFGTAAGTRVGRLLASMFPIEPAFRGRQVATLHAQRDFIFFRHHRYVFEEKEDGRARRAAAELRKKERRKGKRSGEGKREGGSSAAVDRAAAASDAEVGAALPPPTAVVARLQELGPRFTLKLLDLRKGVLCGGDSEKEWAPSREARKARRKFSL
jgi:rRNA maturation protein Rpf1